MTSTVEIPGMAWGIFAAIVVVMLALDLGVFHRKAHAVRFKEAITWVCVWFTLAMLFCLGIYKFLGSELALQFLTGYLIEQSLSVDNIFVFVVVFSYFRTPPALHHRVLFWGILGAVVMRAVFIFAGIALIEQFHWMIYVFGVFLIFTGIKLALAGDQEVHPEQNPLIRLVRKVVPVQADYVESKFFVRTAAGLAATPLFIVLVLIESTDVVFALDSIPAILAITKEPFIVYTSNIFAILGLRSLYFALAGMMERFYLLRYGLAVILVFVGIKMSIVDLYKIPIAASLGVIATTLFVSVGASLLFPQENKAK